MRRLGLFLVAALALMVAHYAPASAATVLDPLDTSSDTIVGKKFKSATDFLTQYKFTVAENGTLTIDLSLFGKIEVNMTLTDNNPATPTPPLVTLSTFPGSPDFGSHGVFSYAGLTVGTTYFLTLMGIACSCGGFTATLSLAATPIPPALIMFLTALGGLGFFGWKRNSGLAKIAALAA